MAFLVEDGTGLTNSNSYASNTERDSYCADRAITDDASLTDKRAQLVRATDLIDSLYVFRYVKLSDDQALENPRDRETSISAKLKQATIVLSLELAQADATPAPQRGILSEEITAGEVTTKTTYDPLPVADQKAGDPYPLVTSLLKAVGAVRKNGSVQVGMMTR